jgi:parvulin-like peptidyl-prolyl isomerase
MTRLPLCHLALMLGLAMPGVAQTQAQPPAQPPAPEAPAAVVARRGEVTLTDQQLRAILAELPDDARRQLARDPAAMGGFIRNRLLSLSLAAEAEAAQLDRLPDIARRLERARQEALAEAYVESLSVLPVDYPGDAELQATYEANRSQFMVPRQYRLAQIFLAAPAGPAGDAALRRLRDYRTQLTTARTRADFADLARRHSEDRTTAARGGELEWTREDRLLPAVRDVAKGLEDGAVSEPIRSSDGWHLVKLLGTRAAAPATFADIRQELVALLRQQRAADLRRLALNELLRRAPVLVDEIQVGRLNN